MPHFDLDSFPHQNPVAYLELLNPSLVCHLALLFSKLDNPYSHIFLAKTFEGVRTDLFLEKCLVR